MSSSSIDKFTKWAIINGEIFIFHPRPGKLYSTNNPLFIKLWDIMITSKSYREFKVKVQENRLVDNKRLEKILAKFLKTVSMFLNRSFAEDGCNEQHRVIQEN